MKYKRENLVVLEYDFNTGKSNVKRIDDVKVDDYLTVRGKKKDNFEVNDGEWRFECWRNKIGETREFRDRYAPGMIFGGIIGVYDTSVGKHRETLARALIDAENTYKELIIAREPLSLGRP